MAKLIKPSTKVEAKKNEYISLEGFKVTKLQSLGTVKKVAEDNDLELGEVFVHFTVTGKDGEELKCSQKVRILGQDGYNKLKDSYTNGTILTDFQIVKSEQSSEKNSWFAVFKADTISTEDFFNEMKAEKKEANTQINKDTESIIEKYRVK